MHNRSAFLIDAQQLSFCLTQKTNRLTVCHHVNSAECRTEKRMEGMTPEYSQLTVRNRGLLTYKTGLSEQTIRQVYRGRSTEASCRFVKMIAEQEGIVLPPVQAVMVDDQREER